MYLNKDPIKFNDYDKGNLYVKISYHLSLLQTGLNNSFFSFFQWVLYMLGILLVTAFLDIRLLVISLLFIPVNIFVFGVGYIFSSYYLAKDQTLYSKLLRYISDTFNSFNLTKALKKEKEFLRNVRDIVELDNYFRIKREIVLRLGSKIIFVSLTLISVGAYIINIYSPFLTSGTQITSIIQILIFALHLKLIYLSLRIGLYYFPLKLGLFLCIPKRFRANKKTINNIKSITFKSRKVKLKKNPKYSRNISFDFQHNTSYILQDVGGLNNNLSHIFAGIASRINGQQWVLKINNSKRLLYNEWSKSEKSLFYIHGQMYSEVSLYQFLEEESNIEFLKEFEIFNFIFEENKFLGSKINRENFSFSEICILQIAHCLIHKPEVIIIDPLLCDIEYKSIQKGISLLKSELQSIIIGVSHLERNNQSYDVIYKI